jgi:sugar lactone lactonase YvrE
VFGQNNRFVSNTNTCVAGASAGGLCTPDGLAVDNAGNLYIAGSTFSRVLEYNAPLATGHTSADAVIGQHGFTASGCNNGGLGGVGLCSPFGVATDANGLFVADFGNNRVVQYTNLLATAAASTSANLVLGQITLRQNGVNVTKPDGLYWPAAVVVDTSSSPNHIYLADTNNSRVLGWSSVPDFKYAGPPDLVIGQPDTAAGGCNQNHTDAAGNTLAAANTLCAPGGVAVDPRGNLYVADSGNFRVLEFDAPFSSGKSANLTANIVFGQHGSFTSRIQNNGGVSAATMAAPGGLAADHLGNLYVADPINNRVLEYDHPAAGDTTADAVFGQGGSFGASACNFDGSCNRAECLTTAGALCAPSAVALDRAGRLYIADSANNRVLIFKPPSGASQDCGYGDRAGRFQWTELRQLVRAGRGRGRSGRRPFRRQHRQLGSEPI